MGLRGSLVLLAVVTGLGASRREARAQAGPPPPYGAPAIAVAKEALHSVTFSRLILRLVGEDEIGVGKDEYRVLLLEDLRRIGYPALGAENLVFEQDHSGQATFTIGGTVTEVVCVPDQSGARRYCAIAIVWELLDRRNDEVVYRVLTRHVAEGPTGSLGAPLVRGAFWRLLARPLFVAALARRPDEAVTAEPRIRHTFRGCPAGSRTLPGASEQVLGAAVVVETHTGHGSGSFISPDGLVLTAAHVVRGASSAKVRTRDGRALPATLLRLDARHDVALLSVKAAGSTPCLALRTGSPAVSEEVYAVGAPLANQLAFSMTRGILSGHREIDGLPLLQTDASVNAGNSGGPLVDHEGRLIGVVRSKVVGAGVEGVAFAIPAAAAQARLGIRAGTSAAAALLKPSPQAAAARPAPALRDDTPDMPIGAVAPTPALRPAPATTQGPPGTTSAAYTPPPAQTNQTLAIIGGVVIAAVIVGGLSVLLLSTEK